MRRDAAPVLRAAIDAPVVPLTKASGAPTLDQIALFLRRPLPRRRCRRRRGVYARTRLCNEHLRARDDDMIAARAAGRAPTFNAGGPLDVRGRAVLRWKIWRVQPGSKALVTFAEAFCKRGRVSVRAIARPPRLRLRRARRASFPFWSRRTPRTTCTCGSRCDARARSRSTTTRRRCASMCAAAIELAGCSALTMLAAPPASRTARGSPATWTFAKLARAAAASFSERRDGGRAGDGASAARRTRRWGVPVAVTFTPGGGRRCARGASPNARARLLELASESASSIAQEREGRDGQTIRMTTSGTGQDPAEGRADRSFAERNGFELRELTRRSACGRLSQGHDAEDRSRGSVAIRSGGGNARLEARRPVKKERARRRGLRSVASEA